MVVAFHAGVDQLSGGFVGVDIFFVLSGYLVTGILVRDLDGPTRRVAFAGFYSRRARRLLPAAAVNLVATAIVFGAIASPVQLDDARAGIRAASLYFANWHFIAQSADYFATDVALNPVQHYWSLSVEEQYYVVWPVLLSGMYVVARWLGSNRRGVVQVIIVLAAVASFVLARHLADHDLSRAYFGTDTRAYQLLTGALLAVAPGIILRVQRIAPSTIATLVAAGLLTTLIVIASAAVDLDPIWRGLVVSIVTFSLIVLLESSAAREMCWLLSRPTLVYLGKISYGTYLWHWLIIIVLKSETKLDAWSIAITAALLATAVASLSYQLLEQPIRNASLLNQYRFVVLWSGLAISLLVGLVVSPLVLDYNGKQFQVTQEYATSGGASLPSDAELAAAYMDFYDFGSCKVSGPVACPIYTGGERKAIIVGESHAAMLAPMLAEVAKRHGLSLYAGFLAYCPWPLGIRYDVNIGLNCFRDQDDLFNRIIPQLDPDIVFLDHRPIDDPRNSLHLIDRDLGQLKDLPDRQSQVLGDRIAGVVGALRAQGRTVVMFEPIPIVAKEDDTLLCLSKAASVAECRFVVTPGAGAEERVMRDLAAADDGVISVDLDPLVCPYLPICDPVIDGLIVKRDDNHLTMRFAQTLVEEVDAYLVGTGVFD